MHNQPIPSLPLTPLPFPTAFPLICNSLLLPRLPPPPPLPRPVAVEAQKHGGLLHTGIPIDLPTAYRQDKTLFHTSTPKPWVFSYLRPSPLTCTAGCCRGPGTWTTPPSARSCCHCSHHSQHQNSSIGQGQGKCCAVSKGQDSEHSSTASLGTPNQ